MFQTCRHTGGARARVDGMHPVYDRACVSRVVLRSGDKSSDSSSRDMCGLLARGRRRFRQEMSRSESSSAVPWLFSRGYLCTAWMPCGREAPRALPTRRTAVFTKDARTWSLRASLYHASLPGHHRPPRQGEGSTSRTGSSERLKNRRQKSTSAGARQKVTLGAATPEIPISSTPKGRSRKAVETKADNKLPVHPARNAPPSIFCGGMCPESHRARRPRCHWPAT